jgi:hypothetical protein
MSLRFGLAPISGRFTSGGNAWSRSRPLISQSSSSPSPSLSGALVSIAQHTSDCTSLPSSPREHVVGEETSPDQVPEIGSTKIVTSSPGPFRVSPLSSSSAGFSWSSQNGSEHVSWSQTDSETGISAARSSLRTRGTLLTKATMLPPVKVRVSVSTAMLLNELNT